MTAGARHRLSLIEYGSPVDLVGQVAVAASIERPKARHLLQSAGERAARTLGFSTSPLLVGPEGVRAIDVAGMVRLAPSLELEIAPKFLGLDSDDPRWREDFYFLANLSRHGRLLALERLRASGGARTDLAALVARSLAGMYWDNRRRPLRAYRRSVVEDFFVDGEIDPFDLCFPQPDGFQQEVIRYDRRNTFNASIVAAAKELLPEVSATDAVAGLVRLIDDLPGQGRPEPHRSRRLPGRYRSWQPVVDLSNDVIKGLGLSYREGFATAPGYLVNTWRVWEHLLIVAMRLVFGRKAVASQRPHALGTRTRFPSGVTSTLNVYPDLIIMPDKPRPAFIIDAKYKTSAEKGPVRMAEADTYEALAFARAAACGSVVLAYPALPSGVHRPLGHTSLFERVEVDGVRIYGVQVELRGISRRSGLRVFSQTFRSCLDGIL